MIFFSAWGVIFDNSYLRNAIFPPLGTNIILLWFHYNESDLIQSLGIGTQCIQQETHFSTDGCSFSPKMFFYRYKLYDCTVIFFFKAPKTKALFLKDLTHQTIRFTNDLMDEIPDSFDGVPMETGISGSCGSKVNYFTGLQSENEKAGGCNGSGWTGTLVNVTCWSNN